MIAVPVALTFGILADAIRREVFSMTETPARD
jgi:hypothetical protein